MLHERRCISCEACILQCTNGAISVHVSNTDQKIIITNRDKCVRCGECTKVCFSDAREIVGEEMNVSQVMDEILRDVPFYDQSGGGVTFSGGEPLFQERFLLDLLYQCRSKDIHTALDTSGFVDWEILDSIRAYVDLFLYDLKLIDDDKHRKFTGVSNQLILSNLKTLSEQRHAIILRIPLIPGVNDDEDNLTKTAEFASSLPNLQQIDILPYHNLGFGKYNGLGKTYIERDCNLLHAHTPTKERMAEIAVMMGNYHLQVNIG